jgi:hypothetical protein
MPSRSRAALLAFAALLLATSVAGHAMVSPVDATTSPESAAAGVAQSEPIAAESVRFALQVEADGDARWRVSAAYPLVTRNDTAGFEELGAAFRDGETGTLGYETFRTAAGRASDTTGREMTIVDVQRNYTIENDTGRLILEFTWTEFARTEDSALYVGDAFNTTDGKWLDSLTARQMLTIEPPPGYDVRSAPVGVVDGVARWEGPETFTGRDPWIVYTGERTPTLTPTPTPPTPTDSPTVTTAPPTTAPPPTPTDTPTVTTAPPTTAPPTTAPPTTVPPDGPDGSGFPFVVVVLLVGIGAAAVGAYTLIDRDSDLGGVVPNVGGDGSGPDDSPDSDPDDGATGQSAAAADGDADSADDESEGTDDVDVELLSDPERVERLLEQNGGRMKQANIVKETGWSNAKVSQLLSSMAEDDRINKLRIGRENLISFPDEDLTDLDEE